MKICNNCKENKTLDNFYKIKKGIFYICKKCCSVKGKEEREYRKKRTKIVSLDPEYKKQCSGCKLYKGKTEFGILSISPDKLSYSCKKCLYSRINKWGLENKSKVKKAKEKWKKNNKDATRAYERNKRKVDKNFQLKTNMRGRLSASFKKFKTSSSIRYLNYTIKELKDHLESKFTNGMTWENYGKDGWEIDHIIPIKFFNINGDYTCKAFKTCWSLSNLQPLWKTTKIAISYGENKSYIGNMDKNSRHILTEEMKKTLSEVNYA